MTREKAYKSRICKNCKWYSDRWYAGKLCTNPKFKRYFKVEKDFSCNKFERRKK